MKKQTYKYVPLWVDKKEFEVTKDHIQLLKNSRINWMPVENEGAFIDFKQPYGSTCFLCDIARILKIKPKMNLDTGKAEFSNEQIRYMRKMHRETQIALQIFLSTGIMETGFYVDKLYNQWEKVK